MRLGHLMITERVQLSARVHGLKWNFGVHMQVRYSSSLPFIGKVGIKLLEVTNTKHGEPSSLHACSPGVTSAMQHTHFIILLQPLTHST